MTKIQVARQQMERDLLRRLYDAVPVGVETEYSNDRMAKGTTIRKNAAARTSTLFIELGILSREKRYRTNTTNLTASGNPMNAPELYALWTLNLSFEEASARLAEAHAAEAEGTVPTTIQKHRDAQAPYTARRGAKRTAKRANDGLALATSPSEETRAIAGPDAPSPMAEAFRPARKASDAEALVMAAQQYVERRQEVEQTIQSLIAQAEAAGMVIDHAALAAAVRLPIDERLETIALVLPYIRDLREQVLTAHKAYKNERDNLIERNKVLVSANAQLKQRSLSH